MDNKPIYKTAEDLGIQQWEHDGLVALVGPLSRDELAFDMKRACGSVCCIGGWVAAFAGREQKPYMNMVGNTLSIFADYDAAPHPLRELYYPNRGWMTNLPYKARGPQAARAIVNFLVTGDPQWDAVMAEG